VAEIGSLGEREVDEIHVLRENNATQIVRPSAMLSQSIIEKVLVLIRVLRVENAQTLPRPLKGI
jgi:hypothetical protein